MFGRKFLKDLPIKVPPPFFFFNGDKCVSASSQKRYKTTQQPPHNTCKGKRLKSPAALLSSWALLLPTAPFQNPAAPAQCNISANYRVLVNVPDLKLWFRQVCCPLCSRLEPSAARQHKSLQFPQFVFLHVMVLPAQ